MEPFVSVLREPDAAFGATEASDFRFEEAATAACDVQYEYRVVQDHAEVIVHPSGAPVKYLKLRFRGDLQCVEGVYGEQWERSGAQAYLEWRSVMPHRALAWYCYVKAGDRIACYGVKTGADCFAFWQVDTAGVTLFLNLCSGTAGTELRESLTACRVVEMVGESGEDAYTVAKRFAARMCDAPILPRAPEFGVNNWYWAYGDITRESVRTATEYLMQMCNGTRHRPLMVIDDGWQRNRTYGQGAYIGGPWLPNERFGDMGETAAEIYAKGARPGLWFRPLLAAEGVLGEAVLAENKAGGVILDPTHPFTLEQVERDARRIRAWGFDLIKHDFTTDDITGNVPLTAESHTFRICRGARRFFDRSITTATAIKRLYAAIQRGAGQADVIGCNVVGHLCAGIHAICRVGNDTSGRSFEWTRRYGVNSMMRLPHNDTLYRVDPDCAAFTSQVDAELNLDYLEMCALTGSTVLASVTPLILTDAQMERIRAIFLLADADTHRYGIRYYDRNANPSVFCDEQGNERIFDWMRAYDGSRTVLDWLQ